MTRQKVHYSDLYLYRLTKHAFEVDVDGVLAKLKEYQISTDSFLIEEVLQLYKDIVECKPSVRDTQQLILQKFKHRFAELQKYEISLDELRTRLRSPTWFNDPNGWWSDYLETRHCIREDLRQRVYEIYTTPGSEHKIGPLLDEINAAMDEEEVSRKEPLSFADIRKILDAIGGMQLRLPHYAAVLESRPCVLPEIGELTLGLVRQAIDRPELGASTAMIYAKGQVLEMIAAEEERISKRKTQEMLKRFGQDE